jgi:serine/threonine-protein kinase
VELLGRGGMGEVWRAYDTAIDRVVALKVLPGNFADDPIFQERFRREAHSAAQLNEPHVVPIHDFGEIEGRLYVTMRLIDGRDLQTVLAEGPLSPERAVRIIEQVAQALYAAHRVGLVHRDIKPSNILLDDNDFAYLIDFGIARAAGETGLTSTGATIGTWSYMAPERFQGSAADARADIYALACVLYESLTGQPPFAGDSMERIAVAHMLQPPPHPSAVQKDVSAQMDDVIATGMAKNPDQRYATTVELARAASDALTAPQRAPEWAVPTASAPGPAVLPPPGVPQPAMYAGEQPAAGRAAQPGPRRASRKTTLGEKPKMGTGGKVAIGLAAAVLLGAAIATTAIIAHSNRGSVSSGGSVEAPSYPSQAPSDSAALPPRTSNTPSTVPTSLTGKWSGPASGDQSGFDVVAEIVDGALLTATVSYPQLNCAGTWTQNGSAGNGVRFVTERITSGNCVPSEVTLTPQDNGTLYYTSTYYAASHQRDFTIHATLFRSANG